MQANRWAAALEAIKWRYNVCASLHLSLSISLCLAEEFLEDWSLIVDFPYGIGGTNLNEQLLLLPMEEFSAVNTTTQIAFLGWK